jgi:transposase
VEDCRHLSRRLERDLLSAGERIVRVPTKMMAAARKSGRDYGKSDPIDALATARAGPSDGLGGAGVPERRVGIEG